MEKIYGNLRKPTRARRARLMQEFLFNQEHSTDVHRCVHGHLWQMQYTYTSRSTASTHASSATMVLEYYSSTGWWHALLTATGGDCCRLRFSSWILLYLWAYKILEIWTLSVRWTIHFWYFCFQIHYRARIALYCIWKQKYQKWIVHRKLRVPTSEASLLFAILAQI